MTSPAYWASVVAELGDPARAEHAAHVLASGLPGRLDESNLAPAVAAVGVAKVVRSLLLAVTLDDDAFPYVLEALRSLPPSDVLAAYQSEPAIGIAAKEALRTAFQDTAPRLVHEVI